MDLNNKSIADIAKELNLHTDRPVQKKVDTVLEFLAYDAFPLEQYNIGRAPALLDPIVENATDAILERFGYHNVDGVVRVVEKALLGQHVSSDEILSVGFMPQGCLSYSKLASELLETAGIESRIAHMYSGNSGHFVVDYQTEQGAWQRCDPKWEKRQDVVFFADNPELHERFREKRLLVHGGKVVERNADGKATRFLEYTNERRI